MNEEQVAKTYQMLEAYLSESGYSQMEQIIDLENYLAIKENDPFKRDPKKYYVSFYGTPHRDSVWSWSFEGHHISLNFTISKNRISFAPSFFGSNPGMVLDGPEKGKRILVQEQDLGFELIRSMDTRQLAMTVVSSATYMDILTTNRPAVEPFKNKGITYRQLNQKQKALIHKMIGLHLDRMEAPVAKKALALLERENFDEITFSWAGQKELLTPHYYRIQGKEFLIEYDCSQDNANHIHTVWRAFDGDFGKDLIREHYLSSGHHQ